jgi:hypothetical protein
MNTGSDSAWTNSLRRDTPRQPGREGTRAVDRRGGRSSATAGTPSGPSRACPLSPPRSHRRPRRCSPLGQGTHAPAVARSPSGRGVWERRRRGTRPEGSSPCSCRGPYRARCSPGTQESLITIQGCSGPNPWGRPQCELDAANQGATRGLLVEAIVISTV